MGATARNLVLVHSDAYRGWVFSSAHPTQGRRFDHARERLLGHAVAHGVLVHELDSDLLVDRALLEAVHDPSHVSAVLDDGRCGEWAGDRPDLGAIAHRMVGGTVIAAEALARGDALAAVHFPGAKHHAMRDRSSGFCVFNDIAVTAAHLLNGGSGVRRIAVLDIDAHHGDGTEALLRDDPRVLTFSVHDSTIFPGTGHSDDREREVFNEPLDRRSGDAELGAGVRRFVGEATRFAPDLVVIAAGADGHETDPLSSLTYSIDGMVAAVTLVREAFPTTPILMGGAGGYQPDDVTPEVWARMALALAA